jgi:hypothetical protein
MLAAIVLMAVPIDVAAQGGRGLIAGRVLEERTEQPVAAAQVELLEESGRAVQQAVTAIDGSFALSIRQAGRYRLRATSIGYAESLSALIDIVTADTLHVILRMDPQAVRLPALEVAARTRGRYIHPGLESFYYRMRRGMGGTFITREEIELHGHTGNLLRFAGVESTTGGMVMSRTGCAPMVYIDGVRLTRVSDRRTPEAMQEAVEIAGLVHPWLIEGIEVYRGAATIPAEFAGSTAQCGVIAIWLRRGL